MVMGFEWNRYLPMGCCWSNMAEEEQEWVICVGVVSNGPRYWLGEQSSGAVRLQSASSAHVLLKMEDQLNY